MVEVGVGLVIRGSLRNGVKESQMKVLRKAEIARSERCLEGVTTPAPGKF